MKAPSHCRLSFPSGHSSFSVYVAVYLVVSVTHYNPLPFIIKCVIALAKMCKNYPKLTRKVKNILKFLGRTF